MSRTAWFGCVAVALAGTMATAQAQDRPASSGTRPPTVISAEPVYTPAMRALRESAQRLRESIQALAQKPPGPERKVALDEARSALLRTQQAMVDLPPSGRATGTVSSTSGYDASVRKLMQAADSLRDSIQEMATQPAGDRRNQAIRAANRALLDTQVAMANAYDLTAFGEPAVTVGQKTMNCVRLEDMWACG